MPSSTQFSHPDAWSAYTGLMKYRGRDWVRTSGYSSVPKPDLPVNPYADTQVTAEQNLWAGWKRISKSDGSTSMVSGPGYSYYFFDLRDVHNAMLVYDVGYDDLLAQVSNETKIKALVKTADIKANLLVSLKEAAKTSSLILGKANTLFRAYKAFKRGRFRETADLLGLSRKTVHNTWLEYKYGWTPLLLEVKGAAEFLAQQVDGRRASFTVSASELAGFTTSENVDLGTYDGMNWIQSRTLDGSVKVKVKLWLELTSPHYSAVQQLGITNPLLYAWEVIPFSFVFDWFISVGDYLSGLSALQGVTVKKAMISSERDVTYTYDTPAMSKDNGSYVSVLEQRYGTYRNRTYSRSSFVVDPFSLYPPVARSQGSFSRMTSALALMRGQAKGLERRSLRL